MLWIMTLVLKLYSIEIKNNYKIDLEASKTKSELNNNYIYIFNWYF